MAEQSSISINPNEAKGGLNLNAPVSNIKPGQLSFAINAVTSGATGDTISYQNEPGWDECTELPTGYKVIGRLNITEASIILLWLVNNEGDSEIGTITDCVYTQYINADCLNHNINHPIHKAYYRVTPKGIEVYYTDGWNSRRYLNLSVKPFKETPEPDGCGFTVTDEIDCNKLNVQPNFSIPNIDTEEIDIGGDLTAGTYQFAVQYGNADSEPYTSFYSVTNPLPIGDTKLITPVFNYNVGKSIKIKLTSLDVTGYYDFINIAVIKTVNMISSVELIGTYRIEKDTKEIVYSGQKKDNIRLSIDDVFEKYPIYEKADDIFTVGDVLGWSGLVNNERINYQSIWSKVKLQWQTHRIPKDEGYKKEITATEKKGYFRDEIYPLEGCFLLTNGHQTDRCHIPAREAKASDLELVDNLDVVTGEGDKCSPEIGALPRWKVYNTGSLIANEEQWILSNNDDCYNGPYQYGEFAYTESSETYPCIDALWGNLAGKPIRHHRFPDSTITHIHDNIGNLYPLGVKIDVQQLVELIKSSSLTDEQKSQIVGFKILRGNRVNNKSVIARGLIHNVLKYSTTGNFSETIEQTIQHQVDSLIKQADDLLAKGIAKLVVGFKLDDVNKVVEATKKINASSSLSPGYAEFKQTLKEADQLLQEVLSDNISDVAEAYVSAGQSIVENLIDIELTDISSLSLENSSEELYFPNYLYNDVTGTDPYLNNTLVDESSKARYVFHSPDTHFYQPYLGTTLKLETVEQGHSQGHIVETKNHAKYQFVSTTAYITAALAGLGVGFASGSYGLGSNQVFDGTAAFTAYKTILDIIYKVAPRRNFCYQYNSIGEYNHYTIIPNIGNKQRRLDIAAYLVPGMQSVGDDRQVNNFQRESSVYLKTSKTLPFTHEITGVAEDKSKQVFFSYDVFRQGISSYYATIKNTVADQYGQIYSYEALDTGYQKRIDITKNNATPETVFGGDCFINQFAYKSKIPFFIDNRIGWNDESDVFYNELNNVGEAKYWFSTDSTKHNTIFGSVFGVKPHRFFWERDSAFVNYGNIFLFAYGIPYFWCESEVNVDYRQAFNDKEGDFFPRVSTGIPDDWFQEINTSIKQDNTYFYNRTYSKQNKENFFSFIPEDFTDADNRQLLTHSAIWSDPQKEITNYKHNNWLIYKPISRFDFPKNYGKLISIDGVSDRAVLVRYENKSQLYNAFLTINTSSSKAAYLGNDSLFKSSPPIDFTDIDVGDGGGFNKMLIRTKRGPVFCDTKRGTVFALNGNKLQDVSGDLSILFSNELTFHIRDRFKDYPVDNHFNGIGLTGVYDVAYARFIVTKKDYECIDPSITYLDGVFYKGLSPVSLTDVTCFTDKSFTFSFGLDINNYVSFHTYIPDYYIPSIKGIYAGSNSLESLWVTNKDGTLFNNFFGDIHPYILEFPYAYKFQDEILQNIKDYTRVIKYNADGSSVQTNDVYFNKAILYNPQQCSGVLELVPKPKNSLSQYMKSTLYNTDSKTITFTKSNNFYNYNTFWSLIKDNNKPIFIPSDEPSMFKELNQSNMNYSKMSYGKAPIVGKELKVRHILDNRSDHSLISEFQVNITQSSYK